MAGPRKEAGDFDGNIRRFTGFARLYDDCRPAPPTALAALVARYSGKTRPDLVVDLGSGTGLSTRYWAEKARHTLGVEPSGDMRRRAAEATRSRTVSYQEGFSHRTALADSCADVVVCLQALHWMEPRGTFAEAARILRPGGVFVSCDYDWPPLTGAWEADEAFSECIAHCRALEHRHGLDREVRHWPKAGHYRRMQRSGVFRHLRETALNHCDLGNDARLVALMRSQGYVAALKRLGLSDRALGLTRLRATARRVLGPRLRPWVWCAQIRMGST